MPQTTKVDAFGLEQEVLGFEEAAPPGSPSDGDAHIVARGATGAFYLKDDCIATWQAASSTWMFERPADKQRVRVAGTSSWTEYDAAAGSWKNSTSLGVSVSGLTASTTQTQGQLPLAHELNVISTCANANDACTLPPALGGLSCVVANDGAQTLKVFPAAGDAIDAGAADAAVTIATGKRRYFVAKDAGGWVSILGA